jgi:hypothetical protein
MLQSAAKELDCFGAVGSRDGSAGSRRKIHIRVEFAEFQFARAFEFHQRVQISRAAHMPKCACKAKNNPLAGPSKVSSSLAYPVSTQRDVRGVNDT